MLREKADDEADSVLLNAYLFCVQREDVDVFEPASRIDPQYATTLARVAQEGVQVLAWQARVNPEEICIVRKLPVRLII